MSQGERVDIAVDGYNAASYLKTKNKNKYFEVAGKVCHTKDAKNYSLFKERDEHFTLRG
jgi:hypothetical protein